MLRTSSNDPGQDNLGKKVTVVELGAGSDFVPPARDHARKGQQGVIAKYSNSHGLCYQVHHDDETWAWYNPNELEEVGAKPPVEDDDLEASWRDLRAR